MTLAEIKSEIAIADENKIPTKKVINQIRDMLETWNYTLQDCYRIMDGYLFVVNKFVEIDDMGTTYTIPKNYYKKVDQKAKGKLWILTRTVKRYGGYKDCELLEPNEENGEFPIGTVFYNEKPVRKTDDPHAYDCFVKASWNCLHNYLKDWEMISEQIQKITKKYLEDKKMSSCKNCRHLINILDEERITCEAHKFSVERDQSCKAYLSAKCKDEKKIKRSNSRVEDMLLEEYEDMLG